MQAWRFLMPSALGFTLRNLGHGAYDKLLGRPSRPLQAMTYVAEHAQLGDPADVLATLEILPDSHRHLYYISLIK